MNKVTHAPRIVGLLLAIIPVFVGTPAAVADTHPQPAPATFQNPVIRQNFPDPSVLRVGGVFYAYGSNSATANIVEATSTDLVHWSPVTEAMPTLAPWANQAPPSPERHSVWAPEVMAYGAGYAMFYVAQEQSTGDECVGLAFAGNPAGPFTDTRTRPLVCQRWRGGTIDPSPFRAPDGTLHLLFKNDGNSAGKPDHLWTQQLDPTLHLIRGTRVKLLSTDRAWQDNRIEAPEMVRHGQSFWLFYSGNVFRTRAYAEGVARCATPEGPCVDTGQRVVRADGSAAGPGHAYIVRTADGQWWMLYHAWLPGEVGPWNPGRQLWLSPLRWTRSGPVAEQPATTRQAAPQVSQ